MRQKINSNRLYLLLLGVAGLVSCYEKEEGCLDALASNFELAVDKNCCCEYPDLIFDVNHKVDSLNLNLDSVYYNQSNQPFIIKSVAFFVSDISVIEDETTHTISETIVIKDQNGNTSEEPADVIAISRDAFRYEVGTFKPAGRFTEVRFSVGLNLPEAAALPEQFTSDQAQYPSGNSLYDAATGYMNLYLEMVTDTTTMESVIITDTGPSTVFTFELSIEKPKGEDLSVPLTINYMEWFREIDFHTASTQEILTEILRKLPVSIYISA